MMKTGTLGTRSSAQEKQDLVASPAPCRAAMVPAEWRT